MSYLLSDEDIERLVIDLVARARQEFGIPEGTPARNACSRLKLNLVYRRNLGNRDGAYDPKTGTIILNQDRTRWTPRHEFTAYHEIMHHLLDVDGELIEHFHEMLINEDNETMHQAKERACNLGAAEFLAPRARVQEAMSARGLNTELIRHVADTLGTGLVASAIRVGHCATTDCYVVIAEEGLCHYLGHNRPVLRVEYASWPRWTGYPLARFSPIQNDHLFHRAWQSRAPEEGPTYIPFPSTLNRAKGRMPCSGEAEIVGSRLLGVLKVREETTTPENQLRLAI